MNALRLRERGHTDGFTLIELMIVVVIIAILAAIAYPLYLSQVRQARRVDAQSTLKQAINRGEQFYSQRHEYPNALGSISMQATTDNGAYKISVVQTSVGTGFEVKATPLGDQSKDDCGTFKLHANGQQEAGADDCW